MYEAQQIEFRSRAKVVAELKEELAEVKKDLANERNERKHGQAQIQMMQQMRRMYNRPIVINNFNNITNNNISSAPEARPVAIGRPVVLGNDATGGELARQTTGNKRSNMQNQSSKDRNTANNKAEQRL